MAEDYKKKQTDTASNPPLAEQIQPVPSQTEPQRIDTTRVDRRVRASDIREAVNTAGYLASRVASGVVSKPVSGIRRVPIIGSIVGKVTDTITSPIRGAENLEHNVGKWATLAYDLWNSPYLPGRRDANLGGLAREIGVYGLATLAESIPLVSRLVPSYALASRFLRNAYIKDMERKGQVL